MIDFLSEPSLLFKYSQQVEDPRDGLMLFGPLDEGRPYGIRAGVVGTRDGIDRLSRWVQSIQRPVHDARSRGARPYFPGFEAVFGIPWDPRPVHEVVVSQLEKSYLVDDVHQRVYRTVDVFSSAIVKAIKEEEAKADVWFVVVPDELFKYCRPESKVESERKIILPGSFGKHLRGSRRQTLLFPEDREQAVAFEFQPDFHNQLKARLLGLNAPTQVVRESTIAFREVLNRFGRPLRNYENQQAAVAWTLSTAAFYKSAGRPWKMGAVRKGVCYIGLVYKKDERDEDPKAACCAAQMFLDSGDGVVFKGAVGPWRTRWSEFHLSKSAARELVSIGVASFRERTGDYPAELFIHGRTAFRDEEWEGFASAVPGGRRVVGIRIRYADELKLFTMHDWPVLRGSAYVIDERSAYLWTGGTTPRLATYIGRETPNPLHIDITRGDADIKQVLQDILALTKLNYNACMFGDGEPVTLKFADAVGEVLTAGPLTDVPPLPFRYYI